MDPGGLRSEVTKELCKVHKESAVQSQMTDFRGMCPSFVDVIKTVQSIL
jgi:hypothetical protein